MISFDELSGIIGRFVLTFGSLETAMKDTIIVLMKHYFPNDDINYRKTLNMILMQNNSFSANLEILKFMILRLVPETHRLDWELLIKDLDYLMAKRNLYIHNMYGIDEDGRFVKYKATKSYKKYPIFTLIEITALKEDSKLLEERYRQFFDSVIEQDAMGSEEVIWISKLPRLKF